MSCAMVNLYSSSLTSLQLYEHALQCLHNGDYQQAVTLFEQVIEAEPNRSAGWYLGLAHLLQGQEEEAQMIWLMAIAEADSEEADLWTGELLQILHSEAEQREPAVSEPTEDEAPVKEQDIQQEQLAWLIRRHIYEIAPQDVTNLLKLVQRSLRLNRFQPDDLVDLGLIEQLQTEPYPDVDTGLLFQVLKDLLQQVPLAPQVADLTEACLPYVQDPTPIVDLLLPVASKLHEVRRNKGLAYRYADMCMRLDGDRADVVNQLCCICQDDRRYTEGIELARRYYDKCNTIIEKIVGNALLLRGLMNTGTHWQEAEAVLHRQTELFQTLIADDEGNVDRFFDVSVICTPLFFYPYFEDNPRVNRTLQNQVAALYLKGLQGYLEKHVEDYQPYPQAPLVRSPEHKKLRIGYLSRFFYRHSIGWLCRWLFEHYDRDRFDVYAYFIQLTDLDDFSKQWFVSKATRSCSFDGDNLGIAKAIREDEIDILVDLDSITSYCTCGVMALKPAPIQVTWLGLDASGLPNIDYFLADPYVLPDDAQEYYAEKIWRLPDTYIGVDGFEVGVPTLRRDELGIPDDAVVYLSGQFAYKRHPEMVQLQLQILSQVPNSYLLIKGLGDEQSIQRLFEQAAEKAGVSRDRLRFLPRDRNEETHRANVAIADVVLDTYPYNGATTTLETLWLGIPLVTRVGEQFPARNSYTMMVNAGLTEGIAWTNEEYVEWGVRLGRDANLRQQVTQKLWRSRQTSTLWNGKQFTRNVEAAYEQMWERYQEKREE
ncbi:O-linked N-acetylglucosamine transferase, SPINDLY family protein [Oscillatoria sp. FACHB-1407]|nr:O-linked N-acetylglucosamine transferase, SPINDLY family protein [Oscillatoria sp. FACHB-1407]